MSYAEFTTWRNEPNTDDPFVSIVIPAYNESQRIVPTIAAIAAHMTTKPYDFEIIVSDDGSSDDTVRIIRDLDLCNVRVLDPGQNRGKGAAVRDGVNAADGSYILFSDADMSTPIEHLDTMLQTSVEGAPVVIGSRAADGAQESDRSAMRQLLSTVLRTLVRMVLGVKVKDSQCGFKLFDREAADTLFNAQTIDGFSFDLELLWLAKKNDMAIVEHPVDWYDAPGSKVAPLRTTLCFLRDLVGIRLRHLRPARPTRPANNGRRHIAVVTALPPSKTTLNEYGHHLTRHLAATGVEVTAYVEDGPVDTPDGVRASAAWRFDSLRTPLRILAAARRDRPDVVMFNLHFTSFGGKRVPAALGLCTPALLRLFGFRTVVLLHNLVDTVDLASAGFGTNRILNRVLTGIGRLLTRVVLRAHKVGTTMPTYVDILRDRYGATNVYLAPHGVFDWTEEADSAPLDGKRRIMTFGKFGTYKKLEGLIDGYRDLVATPGFEDVELVIAGSDSPNAAGYMAKIEADCADLQRVSFTGYVAEEDVPTLFQSASVVAFPYTSTTGSSGPLHQAGTYARAAIVPRVGDFLDLIEEEGFTGVEFDPENPRTITTALEKILSSDDLRDAIGTQNHAAASGLPLEDIVHWHLLHIEDLMMAA